MFLCVTGDNKGKKIADCLGEGWGEACGQNICLWILRILEQKNDQPFFGEKSLVTPPWKIVCLTYELAYKFYAKVLTKVSFPFLNFNFLPFYGKTGQKWHFC